MKDFLAGISPDLAADVRTSIFFTALNNNSLFTNKILKDDSYLNQIKQGKFKRIKKMYLYQKVID